MRLLFNPEDDVMRSIAGKHIVFIHVGKCAGESIIECLSKYLPDTTVLCEFHVYDANVRLSRICEAPSRDLNFVVAKRDPLTRFVSAFNWDKHNLFFAGKLQGTRSDEFFRAFPSVNDLGVALGSDIYEVRRMAEDFSRFGHMGMGQS